MAARCSARRPVVPGEHETDGCEEVVRQQPAQRRQRLHGEGQVLEGIEPAHRQKDRLRRVGIADGVHHLHAGMQHVERHARQARKRRPHDGGGEMAVDEHPVRGGEPPFLEAVQRPAVEVVEPGARRREQGVGKVAVEDDLRARDPAQKRHHVGDDVAHDDVVRRLACHHVAGGPRRARDGEGRAQPLPEVAREKVAVRADVEPAPGHVVELPFLLPVGHEHRDLVTPVPQLHRGIDDQSLRAPDAQTRTQEGDAQRRRGHRRHGSPRAVE
jgi:hypothetical protein